MVVSNLLLAGLSLGGAIQAGRDVIGTGTFRFVIVDLKLEKKWRLTCASQPPKTPRVIGADPATSNQTLDRITAGRSLPLFIWRWRDPR